jgi:hypothetical protein
MSPRTQAARGAADASRAVTGGPRAARVTRSTTGGRTDLQSIVDAVSERSERTPATVRAAVEHVLRSREAQHHAEMQLRRGIFKLADLGMSQRDIAQLAGISQPEVSRRLSRRDLTAKRPSPREVISRRDSGQIDSEAMVRELSVMQMSHRTPKRAAAFDNAASATGTAKELAAAFQDGLLSEQEYEAVRKAIAERRNRSRSV